jgi:TP901 family phage tail tape measure protein
MSEMFYNLKFNVDAKQADRQLKELEENIRKILKSIDEAGGTNMAENFKLSLEDVTRQTNEFYDKQTQSFQKAEQTIAKIKVPDYINNQLEELGLSFSDLIELTGATQEAIEQVFGSEGTSVDVTANLKNPIDQTTESIVKMSKTIKDKLGNTAVNSLKELDKSLRNMQKSGKNISFLDNSTIKQTEQQINKLTKDVKEMMEAISKDPRAFDAKQIQNYQKEIDNLVGRLDTYKSVQKEITKNSNRFENELQKLSETLRLNSQDLSTDEYQRLESKMKELVVQNKEYGKTAQNVHQLSAETSKQESQAIQKNINNVKQSIALEKQRVKDKKRAANEDLKNRERILDLTSKLSQMEKDLAATSSRPRISKQNKKDLDDTRRTVIKLQEELKILNKQSNRKIDNSTFKQYQRQVKDLEHQAQRTRKTVVDTMQDTYYNVNSLIYTLSRVTYFAGFSLGFQEITRSFTDFQMEFDKGMREINALLGQSESQLENYKDEFIDMVQEMPFEMTELVQGMRTIVAAGVDAADSFKVLKSATDLSMIGFIELKDSVKTLTTIMDAWKIDANDLSGVLDTLFVGLQTGKFTMDELTSSMGMIAPVASTAGVSLEEVVSAMAALTRVGLPASRAATSLARMLENIVSPADQAVQAANMLGVEMSELALQSLGLSGFVKEMSASLRENNNLLIEMGTSTTKILREMFPRIQATRAAYALLGSSSEVYLNILDEMSEKEGIAANAIENTNQSLERQKELMKNQLNAAMAQLSKTTAPIASWFYELAANTAAWVAELDSTTIAIGALTTIVAALAPLLKSLFGILSKIWKSNPWTALLNVVIAAAPTVISLIMGMTRESEKAVDVMGELNDAMDDFGAEQIYEASEAFSRMQSALTKAEKTSSSLVKNFGDLVKATNDFNEKVELGLNAESEQKAIEKIIDQYPQLQTAVNLVNGQYEIRRDLLQQIFDIELNRLELQRSMAKQARLEAQEQLSSAREQLYKSAEEQGIDIENIVEEQKRTIQSTGRQYTEFILSSENEFVKRFKATKTAKEQFENSLISSLEEIENNYKKNENEFTLSKTDIERLAYSAEAFKEYYNNIPQQAQDIFIKALETTTTQSEQFLKIIQSGISLDNFNSARHQIEGLIGTMEYDSMLDFAKALNKNFRDVISVYNGKFEMLNSSIREMNQITLSLESTDIRLEELNASIDNLSAFKGQNFEAITGTYTSFLESINRMVELFQSGEYGENTATYKAIKEELLDSFKTFSAGVEDVYLGYLSDVKSLSASPDEVELAQKNIDELEKTFDNFTDVFGDVLTAIYGQDIQRIIDDSRLNLLEKVQQINTIINSADTVTTTAGATAEELAVLIKTNYEKMQETTNKNVVAFYNSWLQSLISDYESKLSDKLKSKEITESEYSQKLDENVNAISEYLEIINRTFSLDFKAMSIEELSNLKKDIDKLVDFPELQSQILASINETIEMLQSENAQAIKEEYQRLNKWISQQFKGNNFSFAETFYNDITKQIESLEKQLATESLTNEQKNDIKLRIAYLNDIYNEFFTQVTNAYAKEISNLATKGNFALKDITRGLSLTGMANQEFIGGNLSNYIDDIEKINSKMVNLLDTLYQKAPNVYEQISQDIIKNAYDVEAALEKFSAGGVFDVSGFEEFLSERNQVISELENMINIDEISKSIQENIELYELEYLSLEDQQQIVSNIISDLENKKQLIIDNEAEYKQIVQTISEWEEIQASLVQEDEQQNILLQDKLRLYTQMENTAKQINAYNDELNRIEQDRLENRAEQRRLREENDMQAEENQVKMNKLIEEENNLKKEHQNIQEEINRLTIQQIKENYANELNVLNEVTAKMLDYLSATKDLTAEERDLYLLEEKRSTKVNELTEYRKQLAQNINELSDEEVQKLKEKITNIEATLNQLDIQIEKQEKSIELEKLKLDTMKLVVTESAKLLDNLLDSNGAAEDLVNLAFNIGSGLATGNWLPAITSGVNIIFQRLNDIIDANDTISKQEKEHKQNIEEIIAAYEQRRAQVTRVSNLQSQQEELQALENELKAVYDEMATLEDDLSYKTNTGFDFWGWVFGTKEDEKARFAELKNKAKELGLEIEELAKTVRLEYLQTIGFSVDTIVSNIESAFQNATSYEDFVQRFGESMEETLKNALMKALVDEYVMKFAQEELDKIFNALGEGEISIEEAIAKLREINWEDMGEDVAAILEGVFGDILDTTEQVAGQIHSDADAVRASLTEQTGNRIVAVFNTMNQRMAALINTLSAQNNNATFDYLDRINSNLVSINNKLHGIIDVRVVRTLSPRFEIK